MNPSFNCNNNNYIISLMDSIVTLFESDSSDFSIVTMSGNKREWVQDWINSIDVSESVVISTHDNIIEFNNLQNLVNDFELPSLDLVHCMSLYEISAYETMLMEIVDIIPPQLNLAVNILLHLKIITNHLVYKFQIFA